jgi:hypothetical protein
MTPQSRDRNLDRVRRLTVGIGAASLAAVGLFAGLAASATKKAAATVTTATVAKKAATKTTTAATTTAAATTTTKLSAPSSTPVQTVSPPVATSGGS